jgi:polyhydroxyalkanoate depolymerase
MLYLAYQTQSDIMVPVRAWAAMAVAAGGSSLLAENSATRNLTAAYELIARAGLTHARPAFGIGSVTVGNREVEVREEAAAATPFGTLLHFKKDVAAAQPRVLLVAPLSGHFATLLRATVRTLLPEHDVFITDWHNARDVPLTAGRFGVDEYVDHLIKFLEVMGPGTHMLAVCQPCVAALAAAAAMADADHPAQPRSLTLMAGPIDTRVNPTKVNELAKTKPIDWFESNLIADVPRSFKGTGRKVYPGFMQLAAFVSMNPDRHMQSFKDMAQAHADDDMTRFHQIKAFYDEYSAVMDLPAEFYLETVRRVFQEHHLPEGRLTWRLQRR